MQNGEDEIKAEDRRGADRRKHSHFSFADNDQRVQNSLKFRDIWIEAFFIQSLLWAFSTLLRKEHRDRYAEHIKEKILRNYAGRGLAGVYPSAAMSPPKN